MTADLDGVIMAQEALLDERRAFQQSAAADEAKTPVADSPDFSAPDAGMRGEHSGGGAVTSAEAVAASASAAAEGASTAAEAAQPVSSEEVLQQFSGQWSHSTVAAPMGLTRTDSVAALIAQDGSFAPPAASGVSRRYSTPDANLVRNKTALHSLTYFLLCANAGYAIRTLAVNDFGTPSHRNHIPALI